MAGIEDAIKGMRLHWVIDEIAKWVMEKKSGSIEINFSQGGVTNLIRKEKLENPKES